MSSGERPVYLVGARLNGRRVVVVGGGHVTARRLGAFLDAGALLHVIAPELDPAVRAVVDSGLVTWDERPYRAGDLAGAWYVLAATDDPEVNAAVVAEAEGERVFCVRADDGHLGQAVTPASLREGEVQIGVVSGGDFRRSRALRNDLAEWLRSRR